ncbi:MAG: hypothetical protein K8T26_12420 [Lentisphaerae bacterium]|nr:hypothetical protein [Lentisphaerota bacterium]
MSADSRKAFSHAEELTKFHPETLHGFLMQEPYAEYVKRRGIALPEHPTAESMPWKLLPELFMRIVEGETPPDLVRDIVLIAEMSKPQGHEKLKAEASVRGIEIPDIEGRTLHDYAMRACMVDRKLLESAHSRVVLERQRAFDYYPPAAGISEAAIRTPKAADIRALEKRLSMWFHRDNMGRAATVIPYEFTDDLWFLIRHGGRMEMFSDVQDDGKLDIHFIRQLHYDVVVFNRRLGELKIKAPDKLHASYLFHFGELLTGDSNFFGKRELFDLERLRTFGRHHAPWRTVADVECCGLVEMGYSIRHAAGRTDTRRSKTCLTNALLPSEDLVPAFAERVEYAVFSVRFGRGGKPRPVRIKAGRRANYCRDNDSIALEEWLRANGFMLSRELSIHAAAA